MGGPDQRGATETLVQHAISGFSGSPARVMPPKGGSPRSRRCREVQRAVVYMTSRSGASFKGASSTRRHPVDRDTYGPR